MTNCPHCQHGVCAIASRLGNRPVPIANHQDACAVCANEPVPFAPNRVTASLAMFHRDRSKPLDVYLVRLTQGVAHLAGHILERHLYKWMRRFRIKPPTSCGCGEWIAKMNAWGIEESIARADEIAAHLHESLKTIELPTIVMSVITKTMLRRMVKSCLSKERS